MSVTLLVDPARKVRPSGAVRCDVAWKLFMPDDMGDVPGHNRRALKKMTNWLWSELSDRLGFLRQNPENDVFIITPDLTESAFDYMIRICSMWSDLVFSINRPDEHTDLGRKGENLWKPPMVNLSERDPGSDFLNKLIVDDKDSVTFFFMPALGSAKAYMRTYVIRKGFTYSRHHSHSAVEEHYLVLDGQGTLRYGGHSVPLRTGDLVSKPVGPDNTTQFIADKEGELKILDIEVWPDTDNNTKDLVRYPDHRELLLRGQGWDGIIQSENVMNATDFSENYDAGYERKKDGSWVPKKMPGMPERRRKDNSE